MLYVDGDKIMQIFSNLISNALRFTEPGGESEINVEEKEDIVECCISDAGIGIAEEDMSRLFSRFEQINRIEGPGYRGTGLGLSICYGIISRYGGEMYITNKKDKGAMVTIKLPFAEE